MSSAPTLRDLVADPEYRRGERFWRAEVVLLAVAKTLAAWGVLMLGVRLLLTVVMVINTGLSGQRTTIGGPIWLMWVFGGAALTGALIAFLAALPVASAADTAKAAGRARFRALVQDYLAVEHGLNDLPVEALPDTVGSAHFRSGGITSPARRVEVRFPDAFSPVQVIEQVEPRPTYTQRLHNWRHGIPA